MPSAQTSRYRRYREKGFQEFGERFKGLTEGFDGATEERVKIEDLVKATAIYSLIPEFLAPK